MIIGLEEEAKTGGVKNDAGQPRYDLFPPEAIMALAELYETGARKYDDRNWEKGMRWGRIFRALMSHAWKFWRGETYDPVDGQHHMIAVAWNAIALFTYDIRKIGQDDRAIHAPYFSGPSTGVSEGTRAEGNSTIPVNAALGRPGPVIGRSYGFAGSANPRRGSAEVGESASTDS